MLTSQIRPDNYTLGMPTFSAAFLRALTASSVSMILPNAQPIIFLEYKYSSTSLVGTAIFFGMNVRDVCTPFLVY